MQILTTSFVIIDFHDQHLVHDLGFVCERKYNILCSTAVAVSTMNLQQGIRNGKAIPVSGHEGPQGCEMPRLPRFLENQLTVGSEVLISVFGCINPRVIMWLAEYLILILYYNRINFSSKTIVGCRMFATLVH